MAGGRVPPRRRGGPRGKARSKDARVPAGSAGTPAKEMHRLTDLDQMKVLADPLRIRILELLCEERTTKQVAEILKQPPTRLYHHVAALERVGLIRLARTRQRRGALEKYYLAVAKTFSADSRLFSSAPHAQVKEAAQGVAAQVLENTAADLRALLDRGEVSRWQGGRGPGAGSRPELPGGARQPEGAEGRSRRPHEAHQEHERGKQVQRRPLGAGLQADHRLLPPRRRPPLQLRFDLSGVVRQPPGQGVTKSTRSGTCRFGNKGGGLRTGGGYPSFSWLMPYCSSFL